jgi:putative aldouronate transport system permease protein
MPQIVPPLSMPIIAAAILLYCGRNEWFHAMVSVRNSRRAPLQVVVRSIVIEATTESTVTASRSAVRQATFGEGMKAAAAMVAMLQIMCVFPFLQRHFLKGGVIRASET